jgi:FkbM family methyltransferase
MKIFYGLVNKSIDVTQICVERLKNSNIITIPAGDGNRSRFFTDPLLGIHKYIIIENNNTITVYDEYRKIIINTLTNNVTTISNDDINDKINNLHSKLNIKYGSLNDELPEQKMAVQYLTGNEKVLEIGGNIGRNSLIIASILGNNNNFVTLECDKNIANQLRENRDLNKFTFYIESSGLSNRKLIQKGWETIPSDTLLPGYQWVNTITLDNLKNKYNIVFDTLVLDCEGAFYYILMDMPEILDNINLIIMENDYWDISKKNYIDEILKQNNFYTDHSEAGGWGPCFSNFFEVWKKSA